MQKTSISNKGRVIALLIILMVLVSMIPQKVSAFNINKGTYKSLNSYPGIKKFNYASKPVRENFVTSDMVDSGYSFKLGSKSVDEYIGVTGTFHDKENDVTRKGFYLKNNTKGKCGVRYNKVFRYNNTWVDVKTTYMNWSLKSGHTPFVTGGFCSVWWTGGVNWVREKHEFFISGTNTPVTIKGFFTFTDVDDCQGLGIPTTQIDKIWTNTKGTILNFKKEDGITLIKSDNVLIPNKSHSDYSETKAATATFSYQFSGKTHTQYVLDGNADNSTNIIGFESAKYIPSEIPHNAPPEIEKKVSDDDEDGVSTNTVPCVKDTWTYSINGLVPMESEPGNFYDGFRFTDTIDSCLEIKDIKVYKNETSNVSSSFTITQSGQTVTAVSKTYNSEDFYGANYQLRIRVGVKATKSTLESHGHFNSGKTEITFKNTGKVIYKDGKGEYTRTTNEVTTTIPTPAISIKKETAKNEYQVGDLVDYKVTVKETRAKAAATNLIITDDTLPVGMNVKSDTITVSGVNGSSITKQGNGFRISVPRLTYGQTMTISFKARPTKAMSGKDVTNTSTVTADMDLTDKSSAKVHIKPFDIEGKKVWDDNDNQDGFRPDSVIVRLHANGSEVGSKTVSEKTDWKYVFENLDRFDDSEKEIKYTVTEDPIKNGKYATKIDGFTITNKHVPEQVTISGKKTWNDANDLDKVRPKRVIVYLMEDGKQYRSKTISTDDEWEYSWTVDKYRHVGHLVNYTVEEKAVDLYDTNINGFNVTNSHAPIAIKLTKYEKLESGSKTSTPIKGAVYLAYKVGTTSEEGIKEPDRFLGEYTTNDNGQLTISGVQPGDYYLVEKSAPFGYKIDQERIGVKVNKPDTSKVITGLTLVPVTTYNQRLYGSVALLKEDNSGNAVPDAEFTLYSDVACTKKVKAAKTNEKGTFFIENLVWGTYYLKETNAPKGYQLSDEVKKIEVGKTKLEYTIKGVNEQKRGKVVLTKTDSTEKIKLAGAIYDLFKSDGTLVQGDLKTDSAGTIAVNNLAWGGYYFKEKTPPAGYGLSDELIRFSVNSTTGGITQYVQAIDTAKKSEIVITKQLKAKDIHYAHGTPSFVFKLSGTTVDGEKVTYYQMVTFSEEYVNSHTDSSGNVLRSTTFTGLKSGTYIAEEMDHNRYKLSEIKDLSSNATKNTEKANFTISGAQDGKATFVNDKIDWRDYSDTTAEMNMIKMYRKLTGIIVDYKGEGLLEGNSPFPSEKVNVLAVYDDGTERQLTKDEFVLKDANGNVLKHVPKAAGEYTATVSYTENDITRTGTFNYSVEAVKMVTISFNTMGGNPLASMIVDKYSSLSEYNKKLYTPIRAGYGFTKWYKDSSLTNVMDVNTEITSNITLYAGWEEKHLNDYSWKEIKEIADSGMAETYFSECFNAVKEDLKDGQLKEETLNKHTKEFDYKGNTVHAMIAGFNQDAKSDGTKAGISFLTYESVGNAQMNATKTNIGGWGKSDLRGKLSSELTALPSDLKSVIVPVQKYTYSNSGSAITKESTSDALWIPSEVEIYGAWGYESETLEKSIYFDDADFGNLRAIKNEGSQYKLFQGIVPDNAKDKESALSFGAEWWLRSPSFENTESFCFINESGAAR